MIVNKLFCITIITKYQKGDPLNVRNKLYTEIGLFITARLCAHSSNVVAYLIDTTIRKYLKEYILSQYHICISMFTLLKS